MMPLALYFLYLSYLHQRRQPTLLTGPWDFGCALLGLSGFLLMGGLLLLSTIDATWRSFWFKGTFKQIQVAWHTDPILWSFLSAGYVVSLSLSIGLLMRHRRKWIVIYNTDRALAEEALIETIDALGYTWKRIGCGLEIGVPKSAVSHLEEAGFHPSVPSIQIQIDSFESLNHVSFRWLKSPTMLQGEVVGQMEKVLTNVESPESSVGGWFLTAAVSIFLVMLLWMIFLIYTVMTAAK